MLLLGIVLDQIKVALSVQKELLSLGVLLFLVLNLPLSLEHFALSLDRLELGISLEVSGLLLPLQDSHGVLDLCFLLCLLLNFTFELLLAVKLPQLGVDLLFKHALLVQATFINKLLLPLDRSAKVVELRVLLTQVIVRCLELHVETFLYFSLAFLLSDSLEFLETFPHLLTDLLGSFKVIVKLLLVHAVLSLQQSRQLSLALLEVRGFSASHVLDAVSDDALLDELG